MKNIFQNLIGTKIIYHLLKTKKLKHRIINEFKSLRFFHKLYEGIQAKDENKIFEIRYQIIGYTSIYEIILNYFLSYYYSKNTLNSKKIP